MPKRNKAPRSPFVTWPDGSPAPEKEPGAKYNALGETMPSGIDQKLDPADVIDQLQREIDKLDAEKLRQHEHILKQNGQMRRIEERYAVALSALRGIAMKWRALNGRARDWHHGAESVRLAREALRDLGETERGEVLGEAS